MNYVNHASYQTGIEIKNLPQGNSNNASINLLHELSGQFKQNDIVIFGFTDIVRFEYGNSNDGLVRTYIANDFDHPYPEVVEHILLNRDEFDFYKFDALQKLKGIEVLSDLVGFDFWYWDWSGCFNELVTKKIIDNKRWVFYQAVPDYVGYGQMIKNIFKAGPIHWETKGQNPDSHIGKIGNQIHADILINFFKNRLNSLDN